MQLPFVTSPEAHLNNVFKAVMCESKAKNARKSPRTRIWDLAKFADTDDKVNLHNMRAVK